MLGMLLEGEGVGGIDILMRGRMDGCTIEGWYWVEVFKLGLASMDRDIGWNGLNISV